jgi:hypothetical protein
MFVTLLNKVSNVRLVCEYGISTKYESWKAKRVTARTAEKATLS